MRDIKYHKILQHNQQWDHCQMTKNSNILTGQESIINVLVNKINNEIKTSGKPQFSNQLSFHT